MSLNIEKLRLTLQEADAIIDALPSPIVGNDDLVRIADAATDKALWGILDWITRFEEETDDLTELRINRGHGIEIIGDELANALKLAEVERPKL